MRTVVQVAVLEQYLLGRLQGSLQTISVISTYYANTYGLRSSCTHRFDPLILPIIWSEILLLAPLRQRREPRAFSPYLRIL